VKKTISIIALAAALLAALTVFVCYDPKSEEVDGKKGYSNPLDKEGDNYLYGKKDIDEKYCTGKNEDGVALIFTDDTKCNPPCDPVIPTITLVGPQSVTINTTQLTEFKKWMHFDGGSWDNLFTADKGAGGTINPATREPCLREGSGNCRTDIDKNAVPKPGTYAIQYRVIKVALNGDTVCNGTIPQNNKERILIVEQYVAADTGTPRIELSGSKDAEFRVGTTYTDAGVIVTVNGKTLLSALDSIVVKGTNSGNSYRQKVEKPAGGTIAFTSIKTPDNPAPAAGFTYTITYYASYKGASMSTAATAQAVRNLKVIAEADKGAAAVIVLAGYKHKLKNGTVIDGYPDTMLTVPGSTNDNYKEKNVEKVYYIKDGAEVPVDKNLVTIKNPSPFITGQTMWGTRTVNYDIVGGSGYKEANAKRNVFLVDITCEEGNIEPEVKASGASEIPAGVVWDYNSSWSVTNKDELGNGSAGFKYFIHFNGLNPYSPKAGKYNITYVGLGRCGGKTELERTITVK